MYELNGTGVGALAATGATFAQSWVAGWTLFVAGLAVVSIARVARMRATRTATADVASGNP